MATRTSFFVEPIITSAANPISILPIELASLHAKVRTDFANVCTSIANFQTKVMSGIDELLYRFAPPPS